MLKKLRTLAVLSCGVLLFCGCSEKETVCERDVFAMDTCMSLKAYGENADIAVKECEQTIYRLENELSQKYEKSCIAKANSANGETVELTDSAAEIVRKANEISEKTDGALDITIAPLVKEWGFTSENPHVPEKSEISEFLGYVDYNSITLNGNFLTMPKNFQIDLGAAAKGYASDKAIEILKKNGVKSAIINLGGNVRTLGMKPDGSEWKVAVRNPFETENEMCVIRTGEAAVITSGNYERFFTDENGRRYWHILSPDDGYPADEGLVSVTVIGENGTECDALSTALFVLGTEKAVDYWRNYRNFDMILVTDDKKILYTEKIADSFSNISQMPSEVITFD
mgnify:CR=1 FL=1